MKDAFEGAGAAILIGLAVFGLELVGALGGGFAGWCIEHTFLSGFVLVGLQRVGVQITPQELPAIGAVLGFVGSFFKSTASHKKD